MAKKVFPSPISFLSQGNERKPDPKPEKPFSLSSAEKKSGQEINAKGNAEKSFAHFYFAIFPFLKEGKKKERPLLPFPFLLFNYFRVSSAGVLTLS